jgi:hypothetical protein
MQRNVVFLIILTLGVFVGIGLWKYLQWHECRDAGMSILYCLQHIS